MRTDTVVDVGGRRVKLSNLAKPLYPTGFTKGQVLDYYAGIAPVLLPHLADRAATFIRFPDGVDHSGFFTKNAPRGLPSWVRTEAVVSPSSGNRVDYVVVDDLPTLMWAANLAAIEIHTPLWRLADPGHPDLLVVDLDPGDPATIIDCARLAEAAHDVLASHGLKTSAKTSGSKGLHLYARLDGATADQAKQLAHAVAVLLEQQHPDLAVSSMAKEVRGGKVFVDWSQNTRSKTTVAPYSLRATMPAPSVSTPVTWDELADARYPDDLRFTPEEVVERVREHGDLL